jgi:hypothetical protein
LGSGDLSAAGGALLASPTFTGTPSGPTAAPNTNTTQLATTAFVSAAIAASPGGVTSFNTRTGAITLNSSDVSAAGGALLNSPALVGNPTAPTQTPGTNSTTLATTAFVQAALATAGGVTSFNGRAGAVTLTMADITGAGGAPLASPTFTGVPAAPTAAVGTSSTQLATTAFVIANAQPGAMVLISTQVASASASLVLNLTGGYRRYRLFLDHLIAASASTLLSLQVSDDGGATWKSAASNYTQLFSYVVSTSLSSVSASGSTTDSSIKPFGNYDLSAALATSTSEILITPKAGVYTPFRFKSAAYTGTSFTTFDGAGYCYATTNIINAIRLVFGVGNIASGTASLYGIVS